MESPKSQPTKVKKSSNGDFSDIMIISDNFIDERWQDCEERGLFVVWSGPNKYIPNLKSRIEKYCQEQVSISFFAKNSMFILCK